MLKLNEVPYKMQAVILAAGKSTRTYPLTLTRPKPLLKVANKTLIEHNLGNLNAISSAKLLGEIIIIVGYKKEMVKEVIKNSYRNLSIRYVEQKSQSGTGNALLAAEKYVEGDFISLNGDDVYSKEDFENVLKDRYSILVKKAENPEAFGVVIENNKILADIIEKPKKFVSDLVNTGLYKLDEKIFPIIRELKKSKRNEYELTDAIKQLAKNEPVHCIEAKQWIPIGCPLDLLKANRILSGNKNIVGKDSKINKNVKNSSVGGKCTISGSLKGSIVMDNSTVDSGSDVEDSVIGENVYFNGRMSGAVIGDNVKAENVVINPGCKIWPNKKMLNETVNEDIK